MTQKDIIFAVLDVIGIIAIAVLYRKTWKMRAKNAYITVMSELAEFYFCQYDLYHMIKVNFFQRFGSFNKEGFCYTFSAAIMLGLKNLRQTRLVRGRVSDGQGFESLHSWVEVKLFGRWFVIDPCFYSTGFTLRHWYRKRLNCKIKIIYDYASFWRDPLAEQFYQRMKQRENSTIFWELFWHYTPRGNDNAMIENMVDDKIEWPAEKGYYIFPPKLGYKFNQKIVNEFMTRPTRKSPRRRTLRRLETYYKRWRRGEIEKTPA